MKTTGYITFWTSCFLIGALCAHMGYIFPDPLFFLFCLPADLVAYLICKEIFKKNKENSV
jgi:hypothetical protein